ncbi:MAG: YifB family Mg chelatase-like AAA ATPase [Balneolales bacterium]|nr:YifB family Mg chelatase-like AAA ATPase [Balneolales bacterium]
MLAHTFCASTYGVDAHIIDVEVHAQGGQPFYSLVGLPDRAVSESKHRVDAAIQASRMEVPRGKIIVNLAPADLPKEGSAFDLPIAIGHLLANRQLMNDKVPKTVLLGELALDGGLRPVKGVLPIAVEAHKRGFDYLLLPEANAGEAAVVSGLKVLGCTSLRQVVDWFNGKAEVAPHVTNLDELFSQHTSEVTVDFADVKGQENVKRAMEVAAAGGHNLVMVGPPGSGKTMLARRLPGILPPLSLNEALETTKIHSVTGLMRSGSSIVTTRPFRAPHHTISDVALVGGGSIPMPGEISLAHNGVLFLDELPEFQRKALEVMRQPLEDGFVTISRARMTVSYPSKIMLVASMNPSPSGDWYDPGNPEGTTHGQMQRYLSKISGPLLDRIDLHVEVNKVSFEELSQKSQGEASAAIRERVMACRQIQQQRFLGMDVHCNAQMSSRQVRKICRLDDAGAAILKRAMTSLGLSARAYDRILKVSRTIADLERSEQIRGHHIAEAVQYRSLDREGWLG